MPAVRRDEAVFQGRDQDVRECDLRLFNPVSPASLGFDGVHSRLTSPPTPRLQRRTRHLGIRSRLASPRHILRPQLDSTRKDRIQHGLVGIHIPYRRLRRLYRSIRERTGFHGVQGVGDDIELYSGRALVVCERDDLSQSMVGSHVSRSLDL